MTGQLRSSDKAILQINHGSPLLHRSPSATVCHSSKWWTFTSRAHFFRIAKKPLCGRCITTHLQEPHGLSHWSKFLADAHGIDISVAARFYAAIAGLVCTNMGSSHGLLLPLQPLVPLWDCRHFIPPAWMFFLTRLRTDTRIENVFSEDVRYVCCVILPQFTFVPYTRVWQRWAARLHISNNIYRWVTRNTITGASTNSLRSWFINNSFRLNSGIVRMWRYLCTRTRISWKRTTWLIDLVMCIGCSGSDVGVDTDY